MSTTPNQDLARYAQTENVLETSRSALAELEHTDAVELFQKQLALLKKRLLSDPRSLRTTFVSDGVRAIAWEFQQEELSAGFTKMLWELLLRNDDMSMVLMRFIWSMPLKFKRKFVKAIDDHRHDGAKRKKMLLSTKGRYAVMAIVEVARQSDARPISLGDISSRLELSLAYLEQLFMKLRRKGLVRSVRGPGGGYVLGRDADAISIGEVMAAVDEPARMTRCLNDGDGCVASRRCNTHFLWDALGAHIEQFLATATLADVLRGRYSIPAARFSLSELAAAAKVGS